MRNLKRTMLAAALLISLSAAGAAMGNGVSAASLEAKEPTGPVSSTGRDYRIALINADRSNGPVIHRPMKEEVRPEKPAAPSDEVKDRNGGEDFRDSRSALQRCDKDDDHPYEGRHERRFDKDDRDGDHHYDGRRHDRNGRGPVPRAPEDAQF